MTGTERRLVMIHSTSMRMMSLIAGGLVLTACASSAIAETDAKPAPIGPYSPSVRAGDFVYVSGQIGLDPATGDYTGTEIEDQATQVLANIARVLEGECADYGDIVQSQVFLTDMDNYGRFNATYSAIMGEARPARAVVEVSRLPRDAIVEIMVVAYVPEGCAD